MPNGSNPSTSAFAPADDIDGRAEHPIHHARRLKVICIGAGASGLLLTYKMQRSFENFDLVLYEKNDAISGTWYENKYPGCACDVPAHIYTWSFEPNPNWSSVYARAAEIRQYFENFCEKYGLRKYIKLQHEVSRAVWNAKGSWDVEIKNLANGTVINNSCDILINATGVLNAWKWPAIPGLEDYKGKLLHTARWDSDVDLDGKHVGLIGNGSSAIQVLPAIRDRAKKITSFIRGPAWVSPVQGLGERTYPEKERHKYSTDPEAHKAYRKELEGALSSLFSMFIATSDTQKGMKEAMTALMKEKLQNERLEKLVVPQWPVGCRRFTPGINYLETLRTEQVEVVYGEIERINERGCVSANSEEHPIDVLICATGFDTSFKPRFPLIGASGHNLSDVWAEECKAYMGFAVADFPNYFLFVGPNTPIGNGPVLIALEAQADYMLKLMNRWQTENIYSFAPKAEAVEDFIEFKDNFMKATVWQQECRSWYKNHSASGKVTALWPGSTLHYLEAMAEPRYDDWDFKYAGNRFAYFGNGFSQTEVDATADWAYYIRNEDDAPYLSRVKQTRELNKSGTITRAPSTPGAMII